jgi:hypothetical protein
MLGTENELRISVANNEKVRGAYLAAEFGAYSFKFQQTSKLKIGHSSFTLKKITTFESVHAGLKVSLSFDKNGYLRFKGLQHLGLEIGGGYQLEGEIDVFFWDDK